MAQFPKHGAENMDSLKRQHEDEHMGTRPERLQNHPVDCENKESPPKYDTSWSMVSP
jgi:hypothetical protein